MFCNIRCKLQNILLCSAQKCKKISAPLTFKINFCPFLYQQANNDSIKSCLFFHFGCAVCSAAKLNSLKVLFLLWKLIDVAFSKEKNASEQQRFRALLIGLPAFRMGDQRLGKNSVLHLAQGEKSFRPPLQCVYSPPYLLLTTKLSQAVTKSTCISTVLVQIKERTRH